MDAPAVAVTRDGKKFAVSWMDMRDGGKDRTAYWTVFTGKAFSPEAALPDRTQNDQGHPSLCTDDDGVYHAVWEDARSGGKRIYHTTSSPGAKNSELSKEEGAYPSIAGGKRVGVVWETGGKTVFRLIR